MQTIHLQTRIAAPPDRCFLLSLNIDLHKESTAQTSERAIAGVTHGIIGPNETVTWQGRHFGFMLTHETLISKYERPHHFQDIMLRGMFKSFKHDHTFDELPTAQPSCAMNSASPHLSDRSAGSPKTCSCAVISLAFS